MLSKLINNQKGFVLNLGLMFMAILGVLGSTAAVVTTTDLKIGSNHRESVQTFYAAESGLEFGLVKMRQAFRSLNPDMDIDSPAIEGITFDELSITQVGSPSTITLMGDYAGLQAFVQDYEIQAAARLEGTNTVSRLTMTAKDELIPIFQFGIFYQADLEILPGPNMIFTGGRIHSNSNMYLNGNNTLNIDSEITCAGDIIRGRKDRTEAIGTVNIMDADGVYQTMAVGFDSNMATWKEDAEALWGGTVQSQDHGIFELVLPTVGENPRNLLGTDAGSMYTQSGLRIINGVAYDRDGNTVDLTDGGTKPTPISNKTFYDQREKKNITVIEVDMAQLQSSSNAMDALDNPPDGCDAGIMFVSSTDGSKSVRLKNGSVLPADGLTVASNNPVYIQGNYNSVTDSPAAVICDAINILSNNWNDAKSSTSCLNDRTASATTTVNAAIISGNKDTQGSQYSGGVENFPRFLENWTNKTFTYKGSLICLWQSQQATGNWVYGSPVYTAPNRNWQYGIDASNLPPGTPRVRNIEKYGWKQEMD